jgi:hypothetical protein
LQIHQQCNYAKLAPEACLDAGLERACLPLRALSRLELMSRRMLYKPVPNAKVLPCFLPWFFARCAGYHV